MVPVFFAFLEVAGNEFGGSTGAGLIRVGANARRSQEGLDTLAVDRLIVLVAPSLSN